jgi:ATP-binding cassette subfamily B protein
MGNHAELLRARGRYYQLYTRQFRREMELEFAPFKADVTAEMAL